MLLSQAYTAVNYLDFGDKLTFVGSRSLCAQSSECSLSGSGSRGTARYKDVGMQKEIPWHGPPPKSLGRAGAHVYDIVSFKHIVLGNFGSLDKELKIGTGRELQWSLSKLFARQGWKYIAVKDWLERGHDLLKRDLGFAGR